MNTKTSTVKITVLFCNFNCFRQLILLLEISKIRNKVKSNKRIYDTDGLPFREWYGRREHMGR